MEDINIKTKAEKINQKEPISNMVPNKETCGLLENKDESRNTKTIANPDKINLDLGKTTLPSINLAIVQKIIQATRPTTNNRPLEVSTGMLLKGRKKSGNKTITADSE
jgi:hypothetical protein